MYYLICIAGGIIASQYAPFLLSKQSLYCLFTISFLLLLVILRRPRKRLILFFLLALCFALAFFYGQLRSHAFSDYAVTADKVIEASTQLEIISLPEVHSRYIRFKAKVVDPSSPLYGKAILLQEYFKRWGEPVSGVDDVYPTNHQYQPCQIISALIRVKPAHGLANLGGFDYEAYLWEQNIAATGYIKKLEAIEQGNGFCINRYRFDIKKAITQVLPKEQAAWVLALSIGDKSLLSIEQEDTLKQTSTGHLFVISGLHIGLIAVAMYQLLGLLRRLGFGLLYYGDWRPLFYVIAFATAFAYALLAGFSLAIQRALIMLLVFFSAQMLGVKIPIWTRYFAALALLLLIDPTAILNTGFVLSFVALFYVLALSERLQLDAEKPKWLVLVLWQISLSLLLLPVMALYFDHWPLLSPVINTVLVPLVSIVLLPAVLIAVVVFISSGWAWPLQLCAQALDWLMQHISVISDLLNSWYVPTQLSTLSLLAVIIASMLVLLKPWKKTLPLAFVCLVAAALLMFNHHKARGLTLRVIDVGQGLSVLISTDKHNVLYDLGASWVGGSMVDMAVLPVLNELNVNSLDTVIISHDDNDHKGDFGALVKQKLVKQVFAPTNTSADSNGGISYPNYQACRKGITWQLGDVKLSFLSPVVISANDNEDSCVLLLEAYGKQILLTGDIGMDTELALLAQINKPIDILLLPHHGSRYSSSNELLAMAQSGLAINSAGFMNRFKHPHPDVIARLELNNIKLLNTAEQGMISVFIDKTGVISTESYREKYWRYWRSQ